MRLCSAQKSNQKLRKVQLNKKILLLVTKLVKNRPNLHLSKKNFDSFRNFRLLTNLGMGDKRPPIFKIALENYFTSIPSD